MRSTFVKQSRDNAVAIRPYTDVLLGRLSFYMASNYITLPTVPNKLPLQHRFWDATSRLAGLFEKYREADENATLPPTAEAEAMDIRP